MDQDRGPETVAIVVTMTTIATIIVLVRLYIRLVITKSSGWDDWIILVAMISTVLTTVMMVQEVRFGLGRHMAVLTSHDIISLYKHFYVSTISYNVALGLIKVSIILQYLRIFATTAAMRKTCLCALGFSVAYTFESVLLCIFSCTPIHYFWVRHGKNGTCIDFSVMWYAHAGVNIFADILFIALPMPILKNLHVPKKQKVVLIGIFALGGFACLTSVLRVHSLVKASTTTDPSYDQVESAIYSNAEVNVAVICASMSTFNALIKRFCPKLLSTNSHSVTRKSRGLKSRTTERTLVGLEDLERGNDGTFRTIIGKGVSSEDASREDVAPSPDEGIKVVTVVSQTRHSKFGELDSSSDVQYEASEVHSIGASDRKLVLDDS